MNVLDPGTPTPPPHTASANVWIKHKEEKTVFWCLLELWVPKQTHYLCLLILGQVLIFSQRIDLTKIPHQNKISFAMYNFEQFFSLFHLVLTLKISLISFIPEKGVHSKVTGQKLLCFLQIIYFIICKMT